MTAGAAAHPRRFLRDSRYQLNLKNCRSSVAGPEPDSVGWRTEENPLLPTTPSFERLALNRLTFGARDTDVASVQSTGLPTWLDGQLTAPTGDDATLDAHLKAQKFRIRYSAGPGSAWAAVDEERPLNYIYATPLTLATLAKNVVDNKASPAEQARVAQEVMAATAIRNTHAKHQLREVLIDFWHNHFNVARAESGLVQCMTPIYDRDVIRVHALGNFRALLEAVAKSASMGFYLDNAESNARQPNENYARELMELNTVGIGAYLGVAATTSGTGVQIGVNAPGYTDQDVIEASRALSGWTVEMGQRNGAGGFLPVTGNFVYNPNQHNRNAGKFFGMDLSLFTANMQQGQLVLDTLAYHASTADFVCRKLCVRLFGDNPPAAFVARAKTAWLANTQAPDQIKKVIQAIVLEGPEIGAGPAVKVRRPWERVIAMLRTSEATVNASSQVLNWVLALGDILFVWPEPDGRPDDNAYWLSSMATLGSWNILLQVPNQTGIAADYFAQTPTDALTSATMIAEHWIERMVGY